MAKIILAEYIVEFLITGLGEDPRNKLVLLKRGSVMKQVIEIISIYSSS